MVDVLDPAFPAWFNARCAADRMFAKLRMRRSLRRQPPDLTSMSDLGIAELAQAFRPGSPRRAKLFALICERHGLGGFIIYDEIPNGPRVNGRTAEMLAGFLVHTAGDRVQALALVVNLEREHRARQARQAASKPRSTRAKRQDEARALYRKKSAENVAKLSDAEIRTMVREALEYRWRKPVPKSTLNRYLTGLS